MRQSKPTEKTSSGDNKLKSDGMGRHHSENKESSCEFHLQRIRKLALNGDDKEELERLLADSRLTRGLNAEQMQELATISLAQGLVTQGLNLLQQLNNRFPDFFPGWQEHAEVLRLLGDTRLLVTLRYRAARHLDPKQLSTLFQGMGLAEVMDDPATENSRSHDSDHGDSIEEFPEFQPFLTTQRHSRQIKAYMKLFQGRKDLFARQWVDRNRNSSGYSPVRREITLADIEDHIAGKRTYGIYLMNPNNTVHTGVIDIDLRPEYRGKGALKGLTGPVKREIKFIMGQIKEAAAKAGMACIGEFSGGKGYHLWFPVNTPVPAAEMRAALYALSHIVASKCEFFQLEIFPKQDRLTGKGLGNLVKLPLGIHRATGKRSFLIIGGARDIDRQLAALEGFEPSGPQSVSMLAGEAARTQVVLHPASAKLEEHFPDLVKLMNGCRILGQLISECLKGRDPGERGRKVMLATIGFLRNGREMLHHLLAGAPDYNRPLLDYEISRLRGTPLGCRRIHSLMGFGEGGLDCSFELKKGEYPHPLLLLDHWKRDIESAPLHAERIENLRDAILHLKTAIKIVERFL